VCCQHFDSELRSVSTTPRFELCSSNTLVLNCRMHQHFFLISSRIDTFIIPCLGFVTNPFGVRYEPFWGFVTNPFWGSLRTLFWGSSNPVFEFVFLGSANPVLGSAEACLGSAKAFWGS
jgi:hypothetical protein